MSNGKLSAALTDQVSRSGIKQLIKKYNASKNSDKETLALLIEQISKTPLFFAVKKSASKGEMQFFTLSTGGQVFIPIFTAPEELGKLADSAETVCLAPADYFPMLAEGRHAVINPFGEYFLIWPELVRDHMLPYIQDVQALKDGEMKPLS